MKILRAVLGTTITDSSFSSYNYLLDVLSVLDMAETEIFQFVQGFVDKYDDLPSFNYTMDHFKKIKRKEILDCLKEIEAEPDYAFSDLKDFVDKIIEERNDAGFKALIKTTQAINNFGEIIDKVSLKGRQDAIDYFLTNISEFETKAAGESNKLCDIVSEATPMLERYNAEVGNPLLSYGLTTGYLEIDQIIRGSRKKHFVLVAGYTANGKTVFTLNYLYNITYILRRDTVLFTIEMSEDEMGARLVAIHSAHEKFAGLGFAPLPFAGILERTLTAEQHDFWQNYVVPDLNDKSNGYGTLIYKYPSEPLTPSKLKSELLALKKKFDLEAFAVDQPELMVAEKGKRYPNSTELQNDILKDLKQICLTYDNGNGILGIFPFQISRTGFERATKNNGIPDLAGLSYSNQAERVSDLIYALWKDPTTELPELFVSVIKHRHGKKFVRIKLSAIWPSAYLSNMVQTETIDLKEYQWDL